MDRPVKYSFIVISLLLVLACALPESIARRLPSGGGSDGTKVSMSIQQTMLAKKLTQSAAEAANPPTKTPVAPTNPPKPTNKPPIPTRTKSVQKPTEAPPADQVITDMPPVNGPDLNPGDVIQRMKTANILVYEDAWGSFDAYGRGLDHRVETALEDLDLTGDNVVRDHDALGNFLNHLRDGTKWDMIIVAAESRNYVRGELWDAIGDHVTGNNKTALVAEIWYLDQINQGRIEPLLNECGINFQKNWERKPESNLNNFIVYFHQPDHPIFNTPDDLGRDFLVPSSNYAWYGDVGDLLKTTGGDAVLLAGTQTKEISTYGTIAECMGGRIIFQTHSTHDFKYKDTVSIWKNYIVYTMGNHYKVNP